MASQILNAVISGIVTGSLYSLIAIGYTVIYNATRVFNLAQGDFVLVAVMLSYLFLGVWHWPELLAFAGVFVGVTLLATFEGAVVIRPFLKRRHHDLGWFIATLAFSLIIEAVVAQLYGPNVPAPVPSFLPNTVLSLGPARIGLQSVVAVCVVLALVFAIELIYNRTWTGRGMRASADDREVAALRGIEPVRAAVIAFFLSGALSGIGGFVFAPLLMANPAIGLSYTLKGFIALAIGGFGSIRGALLGAFVLGIGEQLFDLAFTSRYEDLAGVILLMLVLVVRPTGFFGQRAVRRV